MRRYSLTLFTVIVALPCCTTIAPSQNKIIIPIGVYTNVGAHSTMMFGLHDRATSCLDGAIETSLVEMELPPRPPSMLFDVRFVSPHPGQSCVGEGMLTDIRPFTCRSDTFTIQVQGGDEGYPVTFVWSPFVNPVISGASFQDPFDGRFVKVNMKTDTMAVITNNAINRLNIILNHQCSGIWIARQPVLPGFLSRDDTTTVSLPGGDSLITANRDTAAGRRPPVTTAAGKSMVSRRTALQGPPCEMNGETAERDIRESHPLLILRIDSTGAALSAADTSFQKKYGVRYESGCCADFEVDCIAQYNRKIFESLDRRFGTAWRGAVRGDVVGLAGD